MELLEDFVRIVFGLPDEEPISKSNLVMFYILLAMGMVFFTLLMIE